MSPTSLALAASTCQTDHINVIVLVLNVATHEKEPNQNALSKFDALSVTVVVILSIVNPLVQVCKEVSKDKYPEVYKPCYSPGWVNRHTEGTGPSVY